MKKFNKMLSVILSLVLCLSMVAPALAVTYDITKGDVNVTSEGSTGWDVEKNAMSSSTDKDITIVGRGEATKNTIKVEENVTADITLDNVNIDVSGEEKAAMSIGTGSNVTVELDGENTLTSGANHAGLELNGGKDTSVIIKDEDKDGSLEANGGVGGAGIGAANYGNSGNITIDGSTVTANGGVGGTFPDGGAGIGGGNVGDMNGDIKIINNSHVVATGSGYGAGIGVGLGNLKGNVLIDNSDVTATSTGNGAGIGGGGGWHMEGNITISNIGDDQKVEATGGSSAAGIGGGGGQMNGTITIENSQNVTAIGGINGAGIGSANDTMSGSINITSSHVVAGSSGANSAGIGAGHGQMTGDITIVKSSITAVGENTAGIGTGYTEMTGNIVIDDDSVLRVLTNTEGDDWAVTEKDGESNAMHGRFEAESLDSLTDTVFYLVDGDGNSVKDATGNAVSFNVKFNNTTYKTFAIDLPEAGNYRLVQRDAEGNITGYVVFGEDNNATYGTDADGIVRQDGLQVKGTDVTYGYTNEELPEDLEFPAASADVAKGATIRGEGGDWVFQGWSEVPAEPVLVDGKLVTNYVVEGTWAFVADPVPPVVVDEVELEDEDIPLAGIFTRADAIGYLWEQSGSPEWELSDFEDVPEDHQWAVAIGWAQAMGIAVADEDGNFRPDDLVLRSTEDVEGELQEFLNRYAVYAGIELDADELFIELTGAADDVIMGEEAQVIFDEFFAKLEAALAQAA